MGLLRRCRGTMLGRFYPRGVEGGRGRERP